MSPDVIRRCLLRVPSKFLACLFCRCLVVKDHGETLLHIVGPIRIPGVEDLSRAVVAVAELLGNIMLAVGKSFIDFGWSAY